MGKKKDDVRAKQLARAKQAKRSRRDARARAELRADELGWSSAKARKSMRRLEQRLEDLTREHRAMRKRLKRLARELRDRPPFPPFPPGKGPRFPGGGRPWAMGLGPVVSIEVPLETDDPSAPLWATVSARLPDEITAVGDDGRTVRYRYSAVGSTPQAPRYRHATDPGPGGSERFPG